LFGQNFKDYRLGQGFMKGLKTSNKSKHNFKPSKPLNPFCGLQSINDLPKEKLVLTQKLKQIILLV